MKILILRKINATCHDEISCKRRMKETDWRLLEHVRDKREREAGRVNTSNNKDSLLGECLCSV